jgi:chemotaxis-related protein WspB
VGRTVLLQAGGRRWRVVCAPGAEVAPCPLTAPVPGGPPWLTGIVVHNGVALPLVDLALRLPEAPGTDAGRRGRPLRQMLVIRVAGVALALGVDGVERDGGGDDVPLLDVEAVLCALLDETVAAW